MTPAEIEKLERQYEAERRTRIAGRIDAMVANGRIPATSRDSWIERALRDEAGKVLADLEEIAALPHSEPTITVYE